MKSDAEMPGTLREGNEPGQAARESRFNQLQRKHRWLKSLLRDKGVWIGGSVVLFMILMAFSAPFITPRDPMFMEPLNRLKAPDEFHLFGTDSSGRDIFSMVIFGARISLRVGLSVMLFSGCAGVIMGLLSGYYRFLDNIIMRINDGLMAFPTILLAIALVAVLGPRVSNIIIALGIVYTPRMARIIRSTTLSAREIAYVEAARALGARDIVIALRHILPNCVAPMIVQGTFVFAFAVLDEASLSFLGVGAPPYIPSWGNVISEGRLFMIEAPWITLFPGIAILLTVLALHLLGDGLRDSLDPRMHGLRE